MNQTNNFIIYFVLFVLFSGFIDFAEMLELLKDVYGHKKVLNNKQAVRLFFLQNINHYNAIEYTKQYNLYHIYMLYIHRTMEQIEALGNGEFEIEQFRNFVSSHPALLYPALKMQLAIQKKVLGEYYWRDYSSKRVLLSNGGYTSIGKLMVVIYLLLDLII